MQRTAFLGPAYTFTQRAAAQLRAGDTLAPFDSVQDVVAALRAGAAEFAVSALENNAAGYVEALLTALASSDGPLIVVGEHVEPIRFSLYRRADDSAPLRLVVSDVMGVTQCGAWIAAEGVSAQAAESNGHAFLRVRDGAEPGIGALAAEGLDADGMVAAAVGVQDGAVNFTRFVLLRRQESSAMRVRRALVVTDDSAAFGRALAPTALIACGPEGVFEVDWGAAGAERLMVDKAAARVLLLWEMRD